MRSKSDFELLFNPLIALLLREVRRFARIWVQTLVPPVITTSLYFIIFGTLIGTRVGIIQGLTYAEYIAPGLILMAIITNSYANTVASYFSAKLQRYLEELIIAPVPASILALSFLAGGIARGLLVGLIVFLTASIFINFNILHPVLFCFVCFCTALIFSSLGLINGIYAKSFDDTSIISSFVLTPLTYLGGVFFSISMLPPLWSFIAHINPILFAVNGLRYSVYGITDFSIATIVSLLIMFCFLSVGLSYYFLHRGLNRGVF
ncbi:MAG: ABC transporter permease [Methylacidiphilales bacterium]|nr:ABC transporter permease [Candidatus Methylacidiphilales bacterium]